LRNPYKGNPRSAAPSALAAIPGSPPREGVSTDCVLSNARVAPACNARATYAMAVEEISEDKKEAEERNASPRATRKAMRRLVLESVRYLSVEEHTYI
jgi:hypothetical protein